MNLITISTSLIICLTTGILTSEEDDTKVIIGVIISAAAVVLLSTRNVRLKQVFNDAEDEEKMMPVDNVLEMYAFGFMILFPAWLYLRLSDPSHFLPLQSTLGKVFPPYTQSK